MSMSMSVSICVCVCWTFIHSRMWQIFSFGRLSWLTGWRGFYKLNLAGEYLLTASVNFFVVAFPRRYTALHEFSLALTASNMDPNESWQRSKKCASAYVGFQLKSSVYASKAFDAANRAFRGKCKKQKDVNFFIGRKIMHILALWWQCSVLQYSFQFRVFHILLFHLNTTLSNLQPSNVCRNLGHYANLWRAC